MQETQQLRVPSPDWEDPLEEGTATHPSSLAWRILRTEEPGGLQSMESQWVGHNWSDLAYCYCCSVTQSCLTPYNPMDCSTPGLSLTISQNLLKLMSIESVMLSNYLILCHLILLLPSIFPSIRVFSNELALWIRWPKYWSFSLSPSNQYSKLISFQIDWCDLLAVQGTFKSLLQCHSSKSINCSALSLLYGPTLTSIPDYWKNHSFGYTDLCWQSNVSAF